MKSQPENKTLSIGVLTFNRANMLEELLESLVSNSGETLSKIEVLVYDNGSTDKTPRIIDKYSNKLDMKKLRGDINLRGSVRYKELVELSNGKFIILPGDDDVFIERIFDEIIPILDNIPSGVTLIAASAEVIDQNKNKLRINYKPQTFEHKSQEIAELFEKSIYWLPATFIRTSAINNLEAPNSLTSFDWYLWITAVTKGKTETLNLEVIKYRQHLEKEQNSLLQNNWDMDELIMFIFAIQQGAIHDWISSTSDSELQIFISHLNNNTDESQPRTISTIKYILLVQEISKYSKFQRSAEKFKINSLNSIDPRFLQAILGYSLNWQTFKDIFEKLGFAFEIDSHDSILRDGIFVHKIEDKFQLIIISHGTKIFEGILSESELLYKISDHYNEIMRDLRSFEVSNQITKFEWRAVNVIRKIKKLRYGRTIRLKKKN
jgi:glycosyltransferase involved in cell wall biosynthesis